MSQVSCIFVCMEKKKYDIYTGYYCLGQGYGCSSEPKLVGQEYATSFKIACVMYEHRSSIISLIDRMERGDTYIEDIHFGKWHYRPDINANSWTGKYYETYEEALKSFE